MTEEKTEQYRLRQAEKILNLFATAQGHPARSTEELIQWVSSPEGKEILAQHHGPDGAIIPDGESGDDQ
jgi:hypothetical protein